MILFIVVLFIVTGLVLRHLYLWKPSSMDDFFTEKPTVFAHRGYIYNHPENTLSSFIEAVKKGAKALEVDVVKTKDNKIICSHNYNLETETDLFGNISKLEYSFIKQANTAHRLKKHKKEYIPELIDVLNSIPDEIKINIEIKTRSLSDILIARDVVKTIKNNNINHKVLVSSFNPLVLLYIKFLDKKIRTGFLYDDPKLLYVKNIIHPDCLHPEESIVNENLVKHSAERGLHINVWTTNNKSAADWLTNLGVDGIITDNPKIFSKHA